MRTQSFGGKKNEVVLLIMKKIFFAFLEIFQFEMTAVNILQYSFFP